MTALAILVHGYRRWHRTDTGPAAAGRGGGRCRLDRIFEILAQGRHPRYPVRVGSFARPDVFAGGTRTRLRTRFSQPGKYLLSAEVVPARPAGERAEGKSIRRSFVIPVKEDLAPEPALTSVTTVPPHVSGDDRSQRNAAAREDHSAAGGSSALAVDPT